MLRVLLALSAGAVQILRQRGFWVALVASFLVPRVFQPGGHKVRLRACGIDAPCARPSLAGQRGAACAPQAQAPCLPASVHGGAPGPSWGAPYDAPRSDAAQHEERPARWWPRRRPGAAPAAKPAGPAAPRNLWDFRRARPLFSDAVRPAPRERLGGTPGWAASGWPAPRPARRGACRLARPPAGRCLPWETMFATRRCSLQ